MVVKVLFMSFVSWVFCLCFIFTAFLDLFHVVFVEFLYGGVISEILFMYVDSITS